MRIICAHTSLAPETKRALPRPTEYVNVSSSDDAYFNLLSALWATGEDFAVIEQDVIVRATTLDSFAKCSRDWCAAPYPYLGSQTYAGLGCCRFRSQLMLDIPDLFDRMAEHKYDGHTRKHWCVQDAAMQRELEKRGISRCLNHRPVQHLNPTPSHGCVPEFA